MNLVQWRQTELLRRLRLAPLSTGSIVGARILVALLIAAIQFTIFVVLATALFGMRTHVGGFDADFGVTGTLGQDSADNASAFVTIGRGF